MAKRPTSGIVCPRCGVPSARVIGRSESLPVLYPALRRLRTDLRLTGIIIQPVSHGRGRLRIPSDAKPNDL